MGSGRLRTDRFSPGSRSSRFYNRSVLLTTGIPRSGGPGTNPISVHGRRAVFADAGRENAVTQAAASVSEGGGMRARPQTQIPWRARPQTQIPRRARPQPQILRRAGHPVNRSRPGKHQGMEKAGLFSRLFRACFFQAVGTYSFPQILSGRGNIFFFTDSLRLWEHILSRRFSQAVRTYPFP